MTIRCDRISLRDGGRDVLRSLSLEIPADAALVLIGPPGAGKSALFRVLAGELRPYTGRLHVHGREVVLDGRRNSQTVLVDDRSACYPDFTVWDNLAVPLRLARSKQIEEQVIQLAHAVGLGDCLSLRAGRLSRVGQRRLALARALALRPALLLIDNPMSGLTESEASNMLDDLPGICRLAWAQGTATVLACRNSRLALAFGGATAVIAQGRLQQQEARAIDILMRPVSLNVARVFGMPPINLLRATLSGHSLMIENGPTVPLIRPLSVEDPALLVGIRPEDICFQGSGGDLGFPARIERVECGIWGSRIECRARVGPMTMYTPTLFRPTPGESVVLHVDPGALYLFDGAGALVQQIERATERAARRPEAPVLPVAGEAPEGVPSALFASR